MDFELSADQVALRDAATDLLAARADAKRVRAVVDAGGGWDRDLWSDLCAQGWPGIAVPERLGDVEVGGTGLGWVEAAVLLEAVGASVAPAPVLGQVVALDALVRARADGASSSLDDLVRTLVAGDAIAAVGFRPLTLGPSAAAGGAPAVTGRTEPIAFAPSASLLVVPAVAAGDHGDGPCLVAVELDAPPAAEPAMDRTREVARVELDRVPAVVLGGPDAVARHVDAGAVAHAAELLGVAARALDDAVAYARDRVQFGRPIGSFQAVKHRCADMLVDVEGMRSTAWWAAWCLSVDHPERSIAASTAKVWCSDAADRVTTSNVQVHGGVGFTWESDVHLLLKRAELDRVAFGTASWHRERLADLLRERVAAGEPVI